MWATATLTVVHCVCVTAKAGLAQHSFAASARRKEEEQTFIKKKKRLLVTLMGGVPSPGLHWVWPSPGPGWLDEAGLPGSSWKNLSYGRQLLQALSLKTEAEVVSACSLSTLRPGVSTRCSTHDGMGDSSGLQSKMWAEVRLGYNSSQCCPCLSIHFFLFLSRSYPQKVSHKRQVVNWGIPAKKFMVLANIT